MKRDEIRDKNWNRELLDKGYFIFHGLLNQDDISVIKERVRFIAEHANIYEQLGVGHVKEDQPNAGNPLHRFYRLNSPAYHNETLWKKMISNPRTVGLVRSVLRDDFCVNAGGFFLKPPRHGSITPWHQDSAAWSMPPGPYDPNEPMMFDFWIAIDRATKENGCLQLIPFSQKLGRIAHQQQGNKLTEVDPRDHGYNPEQDAVACEMEPGDILVWHQNALHYSGPNRSDKQRIGLAGTFIAKRDVPWMRAIRPGNKYLDYLPVCENGRPLDLPKEFLIDEDQVLAMAS